MTKYTQRETQIIIAPEGAPIFAESVTTVAIDDEDAGEFVTVKQDNGAAAGKIAISPEDWPALRSAINRMIKECRGDAE